MSPPVQELPTANKLVHACFCRLRGRRGHVPALQPSIAPHCSGLLSLKLYFLKCEPLRMVAVRRSARRLGAPVQELPNAHKPPSHVIVMKLPVGRGHVPAVCRNCQVRTNLFMPTVCCFAFGGDMSPPYRGCFVYQSFRFNSLVGADIIRQNAGTTDRIPSRKHRKKRSGEPIHYLSFPSQFRLIDFYKPAIILLIVKPQIFQYSLLFSLS